MALQAYDIRSTRPSMVSGVDIAASAKDGRGKQHMSECKSRVRRVGRPLSTMYVSKHSSFKSAGVVDEVEKRTDFTHI